MLFYHRIIFIPFLALLFTLLTVPGAWSRQVVDMAGRTVEVPDRVERIATFGSVGVLNAFVELMGEGRKIVHDMPPGFTRNSNWRMQYRFAPQMKGAPVLENSSREILIEEVYKVKPDLSIVMDKGSLKVLEERGFPVIFLTWTEPQDIRQAVALMGEALNKQDVAEKYSAYFDEMVAKAQRLTAGIERPETVLYTNFSAMTQPHLVAEWWIRMAGAKSVTAGRGSTEVLAWTLEDLLAWKPQAIVLTSAADAAKIKADARLAAIPAVRNGAIYAIPTVAHVWGNRTVEQPLTIMWLMNKLYPQRLSNDDLAAEIRYFYREFFHYEMTDADIAEIIK